MLTLLNSLKALVKDERGVTALEYGLIAGLMLGLAETMGADPGIEHFVKAGHNLLVKE